VAWPELIEDLPDGILLLSDEWRINYLNPEAERILSRRRVELLGKILWDEFDPRPGAIFGPPLETLLHRHLPFTTHLHAGWPLVSLTVTGWPISSGIALHLRDCSAPPADPPPSGPPSDPPAHGDQSLSGRLQHASARAGELAHDLNNVFATVLMSSEIIKGLSTDPLVLELLARIESSARCGVSLVQSGLPFSRRGGPATARHDPL
jgi:hypothetical protein